MVKKLLFVLLALFMLGSITLRAQCVINPNNTTPGITAVNAHDTLTEGVVYSQTLQIYIPATYQGMAIDSVNISSVTGAPTGPVIVYDPAANAGETITGGGNGVICFVGSTYDPVGTYPLTFNGTVYAGATTVPLSDLPANFSYTFYVRAPAPQGQMCDTVSNVNFTFDDTVVLPLDSPNKGYLSGSGAVDFNGTFFPFLGIGEKLTTGIGDSVTGAIIRFAHVAINHTDSDMLLSVYVYDDRGPLGTGALTGGPGNALDSGYISLRTIADDVTNSALSSVAFNGRVPLTDPQFFIVVKLPVTTGDSVVLFMDDATTTDGAGYLNISEWFAYSAFAGTTADSIGNFIAATVCGSAPNAPTTGFDANAPAVCLGSSVRFNNVTGNGPTGFIWDFGDGSPTTSLLNPTHTYADTGKFLVTLTASNAGGSVTHSAYIWVRANPTATYVTTNATGATTADGSAVVTVTSGARPFAFEWSADTGHSNTLMAVKPGTYEVTITDSNSCVLVDTIVISYTNGLDALAAGVQIKIYPNPANDVINFVWNLNGDGEIKMYNLTGAVVKTGTVKGTAVNRFDIRNLTSGAYVISVTDKQSGSRHEVLFNKL